MTDTALLEWALRVKRAGVTILLSAFDDLSVEEQEALAAAGDILAGRAVHPDQVCALLAAGYGAQQ